MLTENVSELLSESLYMADETPLDNDNQLTPNIESQLASIVVSAGINALSDVSPNDLNE